MSTRTYVSRFNPHHPLILPSITSSILDRVDDALTKTNTTGRRARHFHHPRLPLRLHQHQETANRPASRMDDASMGIRTSLHRHTKPHHNPYLTPPQFSTIITLRLILFSATAITSSSKSPSPTPPHAKTTTNHIPFPSRRLLLPPRLRQNRLHPRPSAHHTTLPSLHSKQPHARRRARRQLQRRGQRGAHCRCAGFEFRVCGLGCVVASCYNH